MATKFVIDTSVVFRMFVDTDDCLVARELIKKLNAGRYELFFPELLKLELSNALFKSKGDIMFVNRCLETLDSGEKLGFFEFKPFSQKVFLQAIEMAGSDTKGQGIITIYDAYFHSLAIELGAELLTADLKHFRVAKQLYGRIETMWNLNQLLNNIEVNL